MQFNATARSAQGSSASRRLRRAGQVPAIVYGADQAPTNIVLDHNEIFHSLRREEFHSTILDMKLEGQTDKVLLRAVQWHPYKPQVLHVDFQRVAAGQMITTKVPLHFINGDSSPAVKLSHAVITQVITELEISCLPAALPQSIEVDLGNMIVGESLHLDKVKLPRGVTYVPQGAETNPALATAQLVGGSSAADGSAAEGEAE